MFRIHFNIYASSASLTFFILRSEVVFRNQCLDFTLKFITMLVLLVFGLF